MRHQNEALGRAGLGEHADQVAAQFVDIVVAAWRVAIAMAAQVQGNHPAVIVEVIELVLPVGRAAAEPVDKHHGAQGIARPGVDHREAHRLPAFAGRQADGAAIKVDVDGHRRR